MNEKLADHVCSTRTELELVQGLRRRALAFDLVGLVSYETMNSYHADLLVGHMQEEPPPGYSQVSVTQVLRADRAVFLQLAAQRTGTQRSPRACGQGAGGFRWAPHLLAFQHGHRLHRRPGRGPMPKRITCVCRRGVRKASSFVNTQGVVTPSCWRTNPFDTCLF